MPKALENALSLSPDKASGQRKTALLETVKEQLKEADIQTVIFAEAEQNPTTTTCDRGARLARENGCDLIVGVGGGSPMDAAKFIALLAASGGSAVDYIPGGKFADADDRDLKRPPIIAITTTSGTGSEATPFAVVTNPENGNKPGTGHSFWYPAVSIVDPPADPHTAGKGNGQYRT